MMPIMGTIWMILTLGNIAIPGTSSYVGELLVFMGAIGNNRYMGILSLLGMVLGGVYGIWLCNRMIYGELSNYIIKYRDMSRGELSRMIPNILIIIIMGIYPNYITEKMSLTVSGLLV